MTASTVRRPSVTNRKMTALRALSAAIIITGWIYVFAWPDRPAALDVTLPEPQFATDSSGATVLNLDADAWRRACARAGLPDLPPLVNTDPVPAQKILANVREWIGVRDPAALGRLGEIYLAMFLQEPSLECFVAAAALDPTNARWRYFVGVQCQALGRVEQAIDALEQAAKMEPEYPTTHARLGALYLDAGDLGNARQHYQQYVDQRSSESPGYVGLARIALAQNDSAKAEELLRAAVQRTPNDFLAFRLLAQALVLNGKPDEARQATAQANRLPEYRGWLTFDQRLQEAHAYANTHRYLENAIQRAISARQFPQAINFAQELLRRRPQDADTMGLLAGLSHYRGEAAKARELITQAVALAPKSIPLRRTQAEITFAQQRFGEARQAVDALLKLDVNDFRGHELNARLLFLEGKKSEAVTQMQRAMDLNPQSEELQSVFVTMLVESNRKGDAIQFLRALLAKDSSLQWARERLAALGSSP
jgi:tetratricopeptide (TPR) repeat protein